MNNEHNGFFLKYFITPSLHLKILKTFGIENYKVLLNENDKKFIYGKPGLYAIIPIGLFSNQDFILNCNWLSTTRKLQIKMPNITTLKSNLILNDAQNLIYERIIKEQNFIIKENKAPVYINLVAKCGTGKTIMAIHLLSVLKLKCFIIAKSIELITQWYNEIKKNVTGINMYLSTKGVKKLIQQDLTNYDIVLFPDKHLSNLDFIYYLRDNFSMGFIDEQHTYNLETNINMRRFLTISSFSYFFSLTATPRHENQLFLGKEVITSDIVNKVSPCTFIKHAIEIKTGINKLEFNFKDKNQELIDYQQSLNKTYKDVHLVIYNNKLRLLSKDFKRIDLICINIFDSIKRIDNPKIIILTRFNEEIDIYYNKLKNKDIDVYPIYADKSSVKTDAFEFNTIKEELLEKDKFIIIGTQSNLGTGIDLKTLNILHLTSLEKNLSNLEQYFGRVSRNNITKDHFVFFYNFTTYEKFISFKYELAAIKTIIKKLNWIEEIKFI